MSNMTIGRLNDATMSGNIEQLNTREFIQGPSVPESPRLDETGAGGNKSFSSMLKDGIEAVNQTQTDADHAIKETAAGRDKNIHETMLLIERADMTYKFAMQVRNKIIDAYREVMKMQV